MVNSDMLYISCYQTRLWRLKLRTIIHKSQSPLSFVLCFIAFENQPSCLPPQPEPDDCLSVLQRAGQTTAELGLQSSDNESNQLRDTGRGHCGHCELRSCGWSYSLQPEHRLQATAVRRKWVTLACGATRLCAPDCATRAIHTPKHPGTYLAGRDGPRDRQGGLAFIS